MVNVHTLGDAPSGSGRPQASGRSGGSGPQVQRVWGGSAAAASGAASNPPAPPAYGGDDTQVNLMGYEPPADGSPLPTLSGILCPNFRWSFRSFIFSVSVIQVLYFIVTLIIGQVKYGAAFVSGNTMLGPGTDVFLLLGAKYTPYIREGQVYRLVVPIFMHGGIVHILFNLFFQCSMGFRLEKVWGVWRTAVIYMLSGIGGNLFSALLSPDSVSVGASGALFGLLGGSLAFYIMNWQSIPNAAMGVCNIVLIVFINLVFGFSGTVVDNYAHLGGLISGLLVGLAYTKKVSDWTDKDKTWRNVGIALALVYYLVTIIVLFTTK